MHLHRHHAPSEVWAFSILRHEHVAIRPSITCEHCFRVQQSVAAQGPKDSLAKSCLGLTLPCCLLHSATSCMMTESPALDSFFEYIKHDDQEQKEAEPCASRWVKAWCRRQAHAWVFTTDQPRYHRVHNEALRHPEADAESKGTGKTSKRVVQVRSCRLLLADLSYLLHACRMMAEVSMLKLLVEAQDHHDWRQRKAGLQGEHQGSVPCTSTANNNPDRSVQIPPCVQSSPQ